MDNAVFISFLLFAIAVCEILSSEVPRPRGVSLSRASLYIPEKDFVCFDGSKTIPYNQINDDYCDCTDGSDEPGTSACHHGTFHCTNAGHKPLNLASNRVNDGICDCCDGSDEYANKHAHCANNCLELGKSAREEAQRQAELVQAGKQLKAELSQRGTQLKLEKRLKLQELEKHKEEAIKIKLEKESLKKEAENVENVALEFYRKIEEEEKKKKQEAEAVKNMAEATENFQKFDSNQDGQLDLSELQTMHIFDKDRDGVVSEEEAKSLLNNQESVDLVTFVESAWPNIKPLLMMNAGLFKPPAMDVIEDKPETEILQDEEGGGPEEESADEDESEDDEELDPLEESQMDDPANVAYDEETKKIIEKATVARDEFNQAEKSVKDIENEIRSIEEYLDKDFGPEEEFATLEGQCFEFTDHEYVYQLCPFDKVTQTPKSSSSETRLGTWGKWSGPESDKYESALYERGQSCWNGPQRSTQVFIKCASENKITSVSEPNRCEYHFEFVTPAACRDTHNDINDDLHDEL